MYECWLSTNFNPQERPKESAGFASRSGDRCAVMTEPCKYLHTLRLSTTNLRPIQAHVRDVFKTAFMVNQDEDFLQCNGVSTQEAKAFTEETGPGPNPSWLRWDFNHPVSSPWNQAVISQLMHLLSDMQQKWTVKPRSDAYWIDKIMEKFNRIKTRVNRAKSHVLGDLSVETSADVAARLADERDKVLMKARRDTWQ